MYIAVDVAPFVRASNLFAAAGKRAPLAVIRAVNHTGDKARTAMRRVLVKQMELQMKTVRKALTSTRAFNGGPYTIKSSGGNIRLKYFAAHETEEGVSAAPWNQRKVYGGSFMMGGKFPNRVPSGRAVATYSSAKAKAVIRSGPCAPVFSLPRRW